MAPWCLAVSAILRRIDVPSAPIIALARITSPGQK